MKTPKIFLSHLGCAKNMVDSEIFLSHFLRLGFVETEVSDQADLVLINTCGFIQSAKEQSIDTIFQHIQNDKAKVLVAGCLYQRYETLKNQMPEVHGWLGSNSFEEVKSVVESLGFPTQPSYTPFDPYSRVLYEKGPHAYLRISEGCNKTCTFCAIPKFKGKMVSRSVESLVEEASRLVELGVKEINVVSQDTCNYGVDLYGPGSGGKHLLKLLRELEKTEVERIRLLYLYPLWLNQEFYEYMAQSSKICKYIDMPLQHCNQEVLKKMKRPGGAKRYLEELKKIRAVIPGVSLRSTFLVGFPGETEEQFQELISFVKEAKFDWMGAFSYSREEGTGSFHMEEMVHHRTRERRRRALIQAYETTREELPSRIGRSEMVLIEENTDGLCLGRTQHQAPEVDGVTYIADGAFTPGEYLKAIITHEEGFDLRAKIIQ